MLSVSQVLPVLCDGVAVMSSRSSCSHVHTVLSTRPLGIVVFGVVNAFMCNRFAVDGVQSPVYGSRLFYHCGRVVLVAHNL